MRIYLSSPHMGGREQAYVQEAFESNWIAPLGPLLDAFEEDLCTYNNIKHAAALSSGTGAIHLALNILGVNSGDEVLCQSFTFSASVNPVCYIGARPVFIDSEQETWNMDPDLLEMALMEKKQKNSLPAAVIAVHLYGMPAKMGRIMEICREYGVPVIEDAAEALGSEIDGHKAGTWGDIGIYSFNGNKIITTSGGGALVSDNKEYVDQARFLATQARDQAPHYEHSSIGYNYRLSNVLAGIGRGQMEVLPERINQRRANYAYYRKMLDTPPFNGFFSFLQEPEGYFSNRWLTTVLVNPDHDITPGKIRLELEKDEIESRPVWKPMHMQPVFREFEVYNNGVCEHIFKHGLCLPSGSNLTAEDFNRIERKLNDAVSGQ